MKKSNRGHINKKDLERMPQEQNKIENSDSIYVPEYVNYEEFLDEKEPTTSNVVKVKKKRNRYDVFDDPEQMEYYNNKYNVEIEPNEKNTKKEEEKKFDEEYNEEDYEYDWEEEILGKLNPNHKVKSIKAKPVVVAPLISDTPKVTPSNIPSKPKENKKDVPEHREEYKNKKLEQPENIDDAYEADIEEYLNPKINISPKKDIWYVEYINVKCKAFENEEEAREEFDSIDYSSLPDECAGCELYKIVGESGNKEILDSFSVLENPGCIEITYEEEEEESFEEYVEDISEAPREPVKPSKKKKKEYKEKSEKSQEDALKEQEAQVLENALKKQRSKELEKKTDNKKYILGNRKQDTKTILFLLLSFVFLTLSIISSVFLSISIKEHFIYNKSYAYVRSLDTKIISTKNGISKIRATYNYSYWANKEKYDGMTIERIHKVDNSSQWENNGNVVNDESNVVSENNEGKNEGTQIAEKQNDGTTIVRMTEEEYNAAFSGYEGFTKETYNNLKDRALGKISINEPEPNIKIFYNPKNPEQIIIKEYNFVLWLSITVVTLTAHIVLGINNRKRRNFIRQYRDILSPLSANVDVAKAKSLMNRILPTGSNEKSSQKRIENIKIQMRIVDFDVSKSKDAKKQEKARLNRLLERAKVDLEKEKMMKKSEEFY